MSRHTQPSFGAWARRAAWGGLLACLPALLLDWPVHRDPDYHPHFPWEAWWGFFAGLSLASCTALVAVSKLWRRVVGRPEEYYGE